MIQQKENDWVLNLLNNQDFSVSDFKDVGLNADNTSLLPEDVYKQSKQIQDIFKKEDGSFDNETFHKFYENAELMYNVMSDDTMSDSFNKQAAVFGKDNLFASDNQKRTFDETVYYNRVPNPDRTTTGLVRVGQTTDPKYSQSELAQTQKVLANPTEVYDADGNPDWSKAEWHDAPNDSWFTDFTDTRVLAQWESDGEHIDPITGQTMKHQKGQLKLNEEGTYFYENLDGRDIYGKQVLNKMNTLTTDGSFWNEYDFFDSDDLKQKSITGSLMKNAVLVGSMFIPYVGPWIAGLSVTSQLIGLLGTFGKMLPGVDGDNSPILSAMEGWSKSVNRQAAKSQYAMENTWCWENFINLIGDVAGQLKEQRFLFEFAPAAIKGNKILGANGVSEVKKKALIDKQTEALVKIKQAKFSELEKARKLNQTEIANFQSSIAASSLTAAKDIENFTKSYYKVGEILSKGYMTMLTTGDLYGELKYSGQASDTEAAIFTMGYAAAELALLNTDLGSWILPELKASGVRTNAILRKIADVPEKYRIKSASMSKEAKKDLVKYWFQKGKETFQELQEGTASLAGQAVAGALGEGFEETTEELLGDFAKTCYNTYQWLRGEDKRISAWENMWDRYSMSLIGGAFGGGITAVGTNFKTALNDFDKPAALQQLVYMIREGETNQIRKAIDKIQFNDKNRSFDTEVQSDGTVVNKAVTDKSKSKDADVKKIMHQMVDNIEYIIKSEGLNISDNAFIDKNTFNDIKLSVLQQSPVTGLLVQDFNTITEDIVNTTIALDNLNTSLKDGAEFTEAQKNEHKILTEQLKNLKAKKDAMLNGDLAMDYISASLFDLSKVISGKFGPVFFKDYVKHKHNVDVEILDNDTKEKYKKEYENWVNTEGKNDIYASASFFLNLAKNSKEFIQEFSQQYDALKTSSNIQDFYKIRENYHNQLSLVANQDSELWLAMFKDAQFRQAMKNLYVLTQQTSKQKVEDIEKGIGLETQIQVIQNDTTLTEENKEDKIEELKRIETANILARDLLFNLDESLKDFIDAGVINPEIKSALLDTLNDLEIWVQNLEEVLNEKDLEEALEEFDATDPIGYVAMNASKKVSNTLKLLGIENNNPTIQDYKDFLKNKKDYLSKIQQKKRQLEQVGYTDIINFIDKFIKINSDTNLDVPKLINTINGLLYQNRANIEGIDLNQFIPQIKETLKVLSWLEALVIAAQKDPNASLDNLAGYNVTLNEIAKKNGKDWEVLPEISVANSNIILQDINLLRSKLEQSLVLYSITENQKGVAIQNANSNLHIIHFKRLQRLIINIDDDWVGKDKLKQALANAKTLNSVNLNSISKEQRLKIIEETIAIEDALYDFFNANTLSAEKIAKLLSKDYNCFDNSSILINQDTEQLSDRDFLFYLSSRAAVKKSEFIYEFRKINNDKVFPFDIQEEAIYQTIADTLNKKTTNIFVEGLKLAAYDTWEKADTEKRKNILKSLGLNENLALNDNALKTEIDILPKYSNIFLIEGLPGAGKTNAVTYYVTKILKEFHKDLLSNTWVAHTTEKTAVDYAKDSLEIEASKHLDRNKLMSLIYSKYKLDRQQDEEGYFVYDTTEITDEGLFNDAPDSITNPPSIIFIDEISHYTQPELELLDNFAKKYNISIITSGDFDQSTTEAIVTKNNQPFVLTNKPTLFKHSPKLGISIRTNNAQLDKTISLYRSRDRKKPIETFYYEDNEIGLNGVKHVSSLNDLEKSIELLLSTTKEKIGLVYYLKDSPLIKLIEEKYSDKFDIKKGTAAQGQEGQYYIVDLTGANEKDIYTGMTRASQGAILFGNNGLVKVNSYREAETYISSRRNFNALIKDKVEYYNSLDLKKGIETSTNITPKKKVISTTSTILVSPAISTEGGTWTNPNLVFSFDYSGKRYACDGVKVGEVVSDSKIKILPDDDSTAKYILDLYTNYEPELYDIPPTEEEIVDMQDTVFPENGNQLFHSFNTNQPGAAIQNDDKKQPPVLVGGHDTRHNWRIDGFIGIARVLGAWDYNSGFTDALSYEQYESTFDNIKNALFSYEKDSDVSTAICFELNKTAPNQIKSVDEIEYGIMSSPRITKNGQNWGNTNSTGVFDVFDRHRDEKGANLEHDDLNRKTIGATIKVTGTDGKKKRIYIPLFVLGNLKTWLTNPNNSAFGTKLQTIWEQAGKDNYKFHLAVSQSQDPSIPDHIKHLAKLWTFTSGAWFAFSKDWRPRKKLQNWGIQVNTNAISGEKYPWDGTGSFVPIRKQMKNGIKFSKGIYTANRDIEINGTPQPIAPRGHSFIFTTQSHKRMTDKEMMEQYIKQLADPTLHKDVTLVLVATPKVPIEKYLQNLHNLLHNKSSKRLGNNFTSFRIWEALLKSNADLKSFNLGLSEDQINFITEQVNKIKDLSSKEDQKNALLTTVAFKKGNKEETRSVRDWLNYLLNQTFIAETNKEHINTKKLKNLVDLLKIAGISEIHYSHKFKNIKDSAEPISEMVQDEDGSGNPLYTIDGLDFTINAKLDSYMFAGDFNEELASINKKIIDGNPPQSKDSNAFAGWATTVNTTPSPTPTSSPTPGPTPGPSSGIPILVSSSGFTTDNNYHISRQKFSDNTEKIFILTEEGQKEITGFSFDVCVDLIESMPYKEGNKYKWNNDTFTGIKSKKLFYEDFIKNPQIWINDTVSAMGSVMHEYNQQNTKSKFIRYNEGLVEINLPENIILSESNSLNLLNNHSSQIMIILDDGTQLQIEEIEENKFTVILNKPIKEPVSGVDIINENGIRFYNENGPKIQIGDKKFTQKTFFTTQNAFGVLQELSGEDDFFNANQNQTSLNALISIYKDGIEYDGEDSKPLFETLIKIQEEIQNSYPSCTL